MVRRDEIEAAAMRIAPHIRRTVVMTAPCPGADMPVRFKFEQMQHTGSFKPRGAFNALLSGPVPAGGVVAASGGNHGAAVAYAARALGIPAHVFVPETAGAAKIALVRETGADLTVVHGVYADALRAAHEHEARTGAMQVHAYDAPAVVAGQGTVMREWELQGLDADTVLIAVGGGGLIAGALAWLGRRRKVVAVEPDAAATMNRALAAGRIVEVPVGGVAASALGASRLGQIAFALASNHLAASVTVTDAAITRAQGWLWREFRQLVEPGGATALAALLSGAYVPAPDETVAVLVCGGNFAPDPIAA